MKIVNVRDARSQLSTLLERVAEGEEIVIVRNGVPVARLVPPAGRPRRPGALAGRVRLGKDFDDPLPSAVQAPFEGQRA